MSIHKSRIILLALCFSSFAPAQDPPNELIRDRKDFIPHRKHLPLGGKVVGLLVGDPQPVLGAEGRYGPPEQLCFAMGGASYRWVYVAVNEKPMITNLQVPVGDGRQKRLYPSLNMANLRDVKSWGITQPCTLVEVEVNDGLGSPAEDSFVATNMKVLEGTREFPLRTAEAVAQMKRRYADYLKEKNQAMEEALVEAAKKALKDRPLTGPREKTDLMFLTWLPESARMRIHFFTRISDGAFTTIERKFGPVPLPPPGGKKSPPPPPPPRPMKFKTGTSVAIELGMAYEFSKEGKLVRTQSLPIGFFQKELPLVPMGEPRDPFPLPPPP